MKTVLEVDVAEFKAELQLIVTDDDQNVRGSFLQRAGQFTDRILTRAIFFAHALYCQLIVDVVRGGCHKGVEIQIGALAVAIHVDVPLIGRRADLRAMRRCNSERDSCHMNLLGPPIVARACEVLANRSSSERHIFRIYSRP